MEESAIHISLKAEKLFSIGGFSVTNSLLLGTLVTGVLILVALRSHKRLKLIPGPFQNFFEIFIDGFLDILDTIFGDRNKSEKYLPLIATIFLFVLASNWTGLLPGVGSIVYHGAEETAPLFRAPSADLNFTLALAIAAVFGVNILGAFAIGFFAHARKFFNFKNPVQFFIGILEFVSEGARMVSFSFRLFGNVFAGEVLLTIIGFLVPYLVPLPFLMLEVFVGFVQATIFAMLAAVFVSVAITEHEEEDHGGHHTLKQEKVDHSLIHTTHGT
jgi:F-type H+-transporting ATPase subunit a